MREDEEGEGANGRIFVRWDKQGTTKGTPNVHQSIKSSTNNSHQPQTLTMFSDPFSVSLNMRLPFGLDKLIKFLGSGLP